MSTTFTNSMFDQIKTALNTGNGQQSSNSKYKDILKLTVGNVYTVRIVPNVESPEKTFFHYFTQGWNSFSTGRYISTISPQTWGERDPISETRYRLLKHGSEEEKEKAETLFRRESWLANIYVVDDPDNPENNGKMKLLRFGKQLHKIIMDAVEGEDSDEFGARIFDMSKNGCNLKIKAEKQGEFPTYVSSRFAAPSKLPDIGDSEADNLYSEITNLEEVFPPRSCEDLKKMLDEHFYCSDTGSVDDTTTYESPSKTEEKVNTESVDPLDDDKVKELLAGLVDDE